MEIIKTTIPILDNYIAWEMSPHSAQAMRHTNYPHTNFCIFFYNYLETNCIWRLKHVSQLHVKLTAEKFMSIWQARYGLKTQVIFQV